MRLSRIAALWLSPLTCPVMITATCYYPDGSVAGTYNWVPCKNTTSAASTCCIPSEGDVCMSDGLCNWVGHYYFRGACTDKSWLDGGCAQVCQQDSPSSWISLQKCTSGNYCCGSGCCTDATSQFALNSTATVAYTSTSTSSTSTTSKTTTSSTTRTTSSITSRSGTSSTAAGAPTGLSVTAASATTTGGSASSSGGGSSSKNKDLGVALGVGLSGSLIGLACAVAVFLLIRRDKKKQEAGEPGLLAPSAPAGPPMSTVPAVSTLAPASAAPMS